MINKNKEHWISTYGLITVQRILDKCHITLRAELITRALNLKSGLLHHILSVPLNNIYNGIVLQQVQDYRNFIQKLFIDYLLSGQDIANPNIQGSYTHELIEQKREELLDKSHELEVLEQQHFKLITASQRYIIDNTKRFNSDIQQRASGLMQQLNYSSTKDKFIQYLLFFFINYNQAHKLTSQDWESLGRDLSLQLSDVDKKLLLAQLQDFSILTTDILNEINGFITESKDISAQLNAHINYFFSFVLELKDLMQSLPDHQFFLKKYEEHLGDINFDKDLIKL